MMNIIFLGAPGSGKGTQASILSKELSIPQISTGDILRSEIKQNTDIGLLAKNYIDSGDLVPDSVVIDIIKKRIAKSDCKKGFILDGFPRNIDQAVSLDEVLNSLSKSVLAVINIDVNDDVIVKRIIGRFSCADCGSLYNRFFNNVKVEGVCDNCGSRNLVSRTDDSEETIKNRLKIYHGETKKLVDFYSKKDLIYKVDGLKTIVPIKNDIRDIIDSSLLNIKNK